MSNISVIYLKNALNPSEREVIEAVPSSLASLAPKDWALPFVAFLDGAPVLRADWELVPEPGQCLAFLEVGAIPQGGGGGGGGGSDPLRVVLMLGVMYATAGMGGAMLGINGAAAVGAMGVAAANAAVTMLGVAVVNALVPAPRSSTSAQQAHSMASPSPTYSLAAQGNTARVDGAIPEQFGRMKAFPDFAAMPYVEFSGNEQYLYQLLCLGRGEYDIEGIYIEDSPLASFADITYEVIQPGGRLTLFPANVTTSSEVSGQDLSNVGYVGPFVANASATEANFIGLDFIAPRGLYYANDNGSFSSMSVQVVAQYRPVDAVGTPTGSGAWSTLLSKVYSAATNTPQRYSERCPVPPGRYQVRCTRTDAPSADSRAGHVLSWGSLRAYLQDTRVYGDVTLIAMRLRASNNLSQQSSRKVNVICTRRLPVFNGSTWSAPQATRSPSWAFAYACRQAGLTYGQMDLNGLMNLNATCIARGDNFDGRFDNFISFWEALTKIAGAVRAKPFMQGGVIRVVRDQAATIPVGMFSVRNIVKGSLSIDYLMPTADTADCIDVKYFDGVSWAPSSVRAKVPTSTSTTPAKMELFGVTGREHAFREGMYQAAANLRRRKVIRFKTEMEGLIPSFGDLIVVQHDMPSWGQGGDITAWNAATRTATLSQPVDFTTGTHYIALRRRDGGVAGPYVVTAGAQADQVVLQSAPAITPYVGETEERTHFAFGEGVGWSLRARVVSCRPEGANEVSIEAVNEDDYVHTADSGATPPVFVPSSLPGQASRPTLVGLRVQPSPYNPNSMVASWEPTPWANHYVLEQSSDSLTWTPLGTTGVVSFPFDAPSETTYIRAAAVGLAVGPWAQTVVVVEPPDAVTGLAAEGTFDTSAARIRWDSVAGARSYTVEVWTGGARRRSSSTVDNRYAYTSAEAASDGGLSRSITFRVYAEGLAGTAAPAELTLTNAQMGMPVNVGANVGFGSLTVRSDMPTDTDYAGTIIWQGTASGFTRNDSSKVYDGTSPTTSIIAPPGVDVWFSMAHYDAFGKDSLNPSGYFSAQSMSLGGVPTVDTVPGTTHLGSEVVLSIVTDSLYTWNATALPVPTYERATPQVVANQITSIDLKAVSASIGELLLGRMVMDAFGYIRGGQTDFNTGAGYWLGYDDDNKYKFSVGNENDDRFYFDQTGGHFAGQLTVESAIQVPIAINGAFDSLSGWYTYNSGTDVFTPAAPAAGTSIVNDAGNNRLSGTSFDIYSAKFPVEPGQTYTFAMQFIFNNTNGISQVLTIEAHHSLTSIHPNPAVASSYIEPIYSASRSTLDTDVPGWLAINSTFVARPDSKWASIRLLVQQY